MNDQPLTTGVAAELSYLSQQTIIRCCKDGSLKHFRVPPGKARRIMRSDLRAWLVANKIPTDRLDAASQESAGVP